MRHKTTTLAVSALITLAALSGCSTPKAPAGDPAVHSRISSLSDCSELQKEFDQAAANTERAQSAGNPDMAKVTTEYMKTAFERQKELGCVK